MIISGTQKVDVEISEYQVNDIVRNKIIRLMFGPNCRYYLTDWIRIDENNNLTVTDCYGTTTVIRDATVNDVAFVAVLEKLYNE